jgi:hypothetical protein
VHRSLAVLTTTLTGLLAGAMLFIELVLLPFWQGARPSEFREWFARHSGRIRGLMAPLGAGSAAAAAATAAAEAGSRGGLAASTVVAATSATGVVAITVAVNEPANEKLARPDLDDVETSQLLERWARWHDVRVGLGLVGALAAAVTLARSS